MFPGLFQRPFLAKASSTVTGHGFWISWELEYSYTIWYDVIWLYNIHCYIHYHPCYPDYQYCYHWYHYSILKSLSANMILYHIYQLYARSLFATTGHVSNAGGLCFFNRKIGPPSLRKCYHQGPHFVRNMYLPLPETNNAAYPRKLVAKGDKPVFLGWSLLLGASCWL